MYIFVLILVSGVGLTLLVGASKRWRWLVDPPDTWAWFYSQALIKKNFGQRFLLVFTYLLGIVIFAMGLGGIIFYLNVFNVTDLIRKAG